MSADVPLLMTSVCTEASGRTRVSRERVASIRTLKRSLMGMSGPTTLLLAAGVDSSKMACAMALPAVKNKQVPANKQMTGRTL